MNRLDFINNKELKLNSFSSFNLLCVSINILCYIIIFLIPKVKYALFKAHIYIYLFYIF